MKRHLFAVCGGIVALTAVMLMFGYSPGGGQLACDYLESGQQICISSTVTQKDSSNIYLDSIIIKECAASSQQNIPIKDKIIIEYKEIYDGYVPMIGQSVILSGIFSEYSHATNPGEFDAAEYYHQLRIGGRLKNVELISCSERYSLLKETLFEMREAFKSRLYYVFPEKEAGIMCTILLGDKAGLDSEVKAMYRRNGIIHILSISGLHITLVGMGIYSVLRKAGLPKRPAAVIGCVVLIMYGIMTGMGISVCRAIGMYLIRMFSVIVGRTNDMLTALGVIAVILVTVNPLCLKQAGFLLSFGSVIGVGIICPALTWEYGDEQGNQKYEPSRFLRIIRSKLAALLGEIYNSAIAGLSITLMTLPIQLRFYYEVPTYSMILNLFVLPLMGVLLVTGFISMLVPHMGIVGTASCFILDVYEGLCGIFDKMPVNMWNPGKPSVIGVIIYYMFLFMTVWYAYHVKKAGCRCRVLRVAPSLAALAAAVAAIGTHAAPKNSITFLDVGQGDGIVVRTDAGGVYLFDCGSTGRSGVGEYVLKPYLKYYGISRIDGIIVSHQDTDHCNGIGELLENRDEWGIEIKNIFLPKVEGEEFENILSACKGGFRRIMYINAGAYWQDGSLKFTCMHPPEEMGDEDINTASACFLVEADEFTLLLTGDVGAEGEKMLLAELKKAEITGLTVLKVAHHGSKYSTATEFINTVNPVFSVISYGKNNIYGHPHEELLDRLEESGTRIYRTAESGAVTFWYDEGVVRIEEWGGDDSRT